MITVQDLCFSYPGQDPALDGINLELKEGLTLGLAGSNGSGKSTLLGLLAGLWRPSSGNIRLAGLKSPGQEKAIRQKTSLVMQDADLMIIGSTVAEDLSLAEDSPGRELSGALKQTAMKFGLSELLDRAVHELSWGQKKRLCLAAAMHKRPQVLLLDEPFAGLDYPGIKQMRSSLSQNRQTGLTQVIAAHDLEPLADLADSWAVLHRGRLVLAGGAEQVFGRLLEYDVCPPAAWCAAQGMRPWD